MSATNVARAGKRGNICVSNNVSPFAWAYTRVHCAANDSSRTLFRVNSSENGRWLCCALIYL